MISREAVRDRVINCWWSPIHAVVKDCAWLEKLFKNTHVADKDCGFVLYSKQPQPHKNSKCFHWFVSCSFPSLSTLISSHFTRLWRSRRISQWNCYYNNCTLETCTGQRCTYQVKKKYIYILKKIKSRRVYFYSWVFVVSQYIELFISEWY